MPTKNDELQGSGSDKSLAALPPIDALNDCDPPEAVLLLRHTAPLAHRIAAFKEGVNRH